MADFWCILFGIVATAIVCAVILGLIELADARQQARYRRAQRDRVGGSFFHNEQGK